jgi:hypothetical protein
VAASCGPPSFFPDELDTEADDDVATELDPTLDTEPDDDAGPDPDDAGPDPDDDAGPELDDDVGPELDEELDTGLEDDRELEAATSFLPPSGVVPTLLLLLQPTALTRSREATETPRALQARETSAGAFMPYVLLPNPARAPAGMGPRGALELARGLGTAAWRRDQSL